MLSLLLAILISSSARVSFGAPGFQTSFGFGSEGFTRPFYGFSTYNPSSYYYGQQSPQYNNYGHYGLPNYYGQQSSHYNKYGQQSQHYNNYGYYGYPNYYGQQSPHYNNYGHYRFPNYKFRTAEKTPMSPKYSTTPYTVFYETYHKTSNVEYPYYSREPFFETYETYNVYNNTKFSFENDKISVIRQNSTNEKTSNETSTESERDSTFSPKSENSKTGQDLIVTYLGSATPSDFCSVSLSSANNLLYRVPGPAYPRPIKIIYSNPRRSSSPPVFNSPQTSEFDVPLQGLYLTPYSICNNSPKLQPSQFLRNTNSSFQDSPAPYFSPVSTSPIPDNNPYTNSELPKNPNENNCYILLETRPAMENLPDQLKDAHRSSSEPVLGVIRPILPLLLQRTTKLINTRPSPVLPVTPKPGISTGTSTGTYSKNGFTEKEGKYQQYENHNYDTGFETHLPNYYLYSKLHTDKGTATEVIEKEGAHRFSTGTNFKTGWFNRLF